MIRRTAVIATGSTVMLVAGALALFATGDPDDSGTTRPDAECPGSPAQMVKGHYEIDTNAPLSPSAVAALEAELPTIFPLANSAAFQPIAMQEAQANSADSDPDMQTFEMRSPTGALLARVDTRLIAGNGWAVTGWDGCAYLTGGPGIPPANYSYDPNASTDE